MSQQPITAILNFDDVYFKFLRQLISKLYRFFFRQSSKTKNKFAEINQGNFIRGEGSDSLKTALETKGKTA